MKRLFFAALVAVAAVGSAHAIDVYGPNGSADPKIGTCDVDGISCEVSGPLYDANGRLYLPGELAEFNFTPDN